MSIIFYNFDKFLQVFKTILHFFESKNKVIISLFNKLNKNLDE